MEAVLLDPAGECVQRLRRPTHKESYDAFMRQLLHFGAANIYSKM
jgi:fructokinase